MTANTYLISFLDQDYNIYNILQFSDKQRSVNSLAEQNNNLGNICGL
jgi:hypothetical protein